MTFPNNQTIGTTDIEYPKASYIGHAQFVDDDGDIQTVSENGGHLGMQGKRTILRRRVICS